MGYKHKLDPLDTIGNFSYPGDPVDSANEKIRIVPYEYAVMLKGAGYDDPSMFGYRYNIRIKANAAVHGKLIGNTVSAGGVIDISAVYDGREWGHSFVTPRSGGSYGKYCPQNTGIVKAPFYHEVFHWLRAKGIDVLITKDVLYYWEIHDTKLRSYSGYTEYRDAERDALLAVLYVILDYPNHPTMKTTGPHKDYIYRLLDIVS
jgi:hypothetical protein